MSPMVSLNNLQPFQAVNLLSDPGHIAGPVVIPNAARVRLNWTLGNGKTAHNILYAQWNGTPALSPTVAEAIRAGLVAGAAGTGLFALLAPSCFFAGVTLLDVRSTTGTEINSTGAATPGVTAGPLPDEVALVITLRTANRGPSGRGRIYIPGFAASTVTSGNVATAGAVSALTTWATSNLLPVISSNLGPVVLGLPARAAYTSSSTGRVFGPRAATTVLVTAALCRNNTFDSQRRRGLR